MALLPWSRREALLAGLAVAAPVWGADDRRSFAMPDGACDAHHHIYDPRFPYVPNQHATPDATVPDYQDFRRPLGLSRDVIVLPSAYGTNNDPLLFFEGLMGQADTRSIAVLHADVGDAQLKDLHAIGVRGVRIQYFDDPARGLIRPEEIVPVAKRIAPLGWHIQFHVPGPLLAQLEPVLLSLPTAVVIDHMGHASSVDQPQYATVRKLLDTGRGWIKVSGMEMDSKVGPPLYSDTAAVTGAYIRANPDRVVWGTNWPVTKSNQFDLLNALAVAAGSPKRLHQVLVENPEALYGFDPKRRPAALKSRASKIRDEA
ncbi:amidohydrolase family protein [Sphingomonas crusticola]|uniref:amidohydrolase family protein n=1 Tax=Sphingomonas crusticola TaxID=1697973 RepID=UPI000E24A195|nr:amidohydrolase family protein [Sphingomonas crusticola]